VLYTAVVQLRAGGREEVTPGPPTDPLLEGFGQRPVVQPTDSPGHQRGARFKNEYWVATTGGSRPIGAHEAVKKRGTVRTLLSRASIPMIGVITDALMAVKSQQGQYRTGDGSPANL